LWGLSHPKFSTTPSTLNCLRSKPNRNRTKLKLDPSRFDFTLLKLKILAESLRKSLEEV